ncbi:hypothetical protein BB8028_0004g00080 [Beauveria bassiana]|uniref:Uncharacterized protein n=1 Tax=Beauveria bassiana TaxID=176275 RepID=A0A2S7YA97_BEABA|nr:hypothetical protein BB8028_0004g00080 [Beauveria bassiana]
MQSTPDRVRCVNTASGRRRIIGTQSVAIIGICARPRRFGPDTRRLHWQMFPNFLSSCILPVLLEYTPTGCPSWIWAEVQPSNKNDADTRDLWQLISLYRLSSASAACLLDTIFSSQFIQTECKNISAEMALRELWVGGAVPAQRHSAFKVHISLNLCEVSLQTMCASNSSWYGTTVTDDPCLCQV